MQWVGIAIALVAALAVGFLAAVLWGRRSASVIRESPESVRARVEKDAQDYLEQERSRKGEDALETLRKKYGEGERK